MKVHKNRKEKKATTEVKKPSDFPEGKKHKSMDSDEDDEVPQNEPGTSSNTQLPAPVPPFQSGAREGDYTGWTDPNNYQFTRSIDQYNLDQFTKNIDEYQL